MATLRATELRAGTPADLPAVGEVMRDAFDPRYGEAWTGAQCLGMLALPGVWLTLAHADGGLVGFALARAVLDEAELLLLAVRPRWRGGGIGSALLRSVIAEAQARRIGRLHLEVRSNNPAVALYCDHKFQKTGERRNYYRGTSGEMFDAHSYSLQLDRISSF